MQFDEPQFTKERAELGVGVLPFDTSGVAEDTRGLVTAAFGAKVREKAGPELSRLAHVEDESRRSEHAIHAGFVFAGGADFVAERLTMGGRGLRRANVQAWWRGGHAGMVCGGAVEGNV